LTQRRESFALCAWPFVLSRRAPAARVQRFVGAALDWESTRSDSSRLTIQAPPTIPPPRSHVAIS